LYKIIRGQNSVYIFGITSKTQIPITLNWNYLKGSKTPRLQFRKQ